MLAKAAWINGRSSCDALVTVACVSSAVATAAVEPRAFKRCKRGERFISQTLWSIKRKKFFGQSTWIVSAVNYFSKPIATCLILQAIDLILIAMKRQNKNPAIALAFLAAFVLVGCCCGPISLLFGPLREQPGPASIASNGEGGPLHHPDSNSSGNNQSNLQPRSNESPRTPDSSIANAADLSPHQVRNAGTQPSVVKSTKKMSTDRMPQVEPIKERTPVLREWTSGQFKTSATFLSINDGVVSLQKAAGTADIPLERLSPTDRDYVKQMVRIDVSENVIVAKVTAVIDGDTFTAVDEDNRSYKIRLKGIDSPEIGQVFGDKAKQALEKLILGHTPWIEWHQIDKQGCTEGKVFLAGSSVNLHMLSEGLAWHLKVEDSDARLRNAELVARSNRIGLWANESPAPPWEYREHKSRNANQ